MPVQKTAETDFRATSGPFPQRAGTNRLAARWKAALVTIWNTLVYYDPPGFRKTMYAIQKYMGARMPGNRRAYRVEDLPKDLGEKILNAPPPEPTPHLDRLLK